MFKNDWYKKQATTARGTFMPKWDRKTIMDIISQLEVMHDVIDIQYGLIKKFGISIYSARLWVEMARRIMTDMHNGLNVNDAFDRDKERRNNFRRIKKVA